MWRTGSDGLPPHFTGLATDTHAHTHKDTPSRAVLSTPVRAKMQGISLWILAYTIKMQPLSWKAVCQVWSCMCAFRRGE